MRKGACTHVYIFSGVLYHVDANAAKVLSGQGNIVFHSQYIHVHPIHIDIDRL